MSLLVASAYGHICSALFVFVPAMACRLFEVHSEATNDPDEVTNKREAFAIHGQADYQARGEKSYSIRICRCSEAACWRTSVATAEQSNDDNR